LNDRVDDRSQAIDDRGARVFVDAPRERARERAFDEGFEVAALLRKVAAILTQRIEDRAGYEVRNEEAFHRFPQELHGRLGRQCHGAMLPLSPLRRLALFWFCRCVLICR
jgi:hypothetical protein